MSKNFYEYLQCDKCNTIYDKKEIHTFCFKDSQPLTARYNPNKLFLKSKLKNRDATMWRYHEMLPIKKCENRVSLEEGFTPLLSLTNLQSKFNQSKLYLKDESGNPTGSFKARGISMAISKAKELGIKAVCIPTAGNAGSALSAYCAKAKIEAHIFMPEETPKIFKLDCGIMGASVTTVKGDITDAAQLMNSKNKGNWFDISTLKEPFRLEGKKTMGYEIAEQLNWVLPDVIIYPTGGGTGLIGIWKAFLEMLVMKWVKNIPTRMVAVQSTKCDPVVQSFKKKLQYIPPYEKPKQTIAFGLRVPKPFGDRLVMKTLYESNGTAISVSDEEIKDAIEDFAKNEGLFLSPEGASTWIAYKKLKMRKWIQEKETVVLLNTGSAYKYIENFFG